MTLLLVATIKELIGLTRSRISQTVQVWNFYCHLIRVDCRFISWQTHREVKTTLQIRHQEDIKTTYLVLYTLLVAQMFYSVNRPVNSVWANKIIDLPETTNLINQFFCKLQQSIFRSFRTRRRLILCGCNQLIRSNRTSLISVK